jgi:DNA-binding protein YbaB
MSGLADSLLARIARQRDLMSAMAEQSRTLSARVTSRDRNVSVEVDGFGAMTGLWLGPAAHQLGAQALSALIVDTAQAAAAVVMQRQSELTGEFSTRMRALQESPLTRWDGTVFTQKTQQ